MTNGSRPVTYFSSQSRTLDTEDRISLTSVGIDIGSSTSHLVFSRIVMERRDNLYVVSSREVLFESDVILTPYKDDRTIDASALQPFIEAQYEQAGIEVDDVDAGALILTGVAVRRRNARAIGELFADQSGKFIAVSAGDSLETALVAYGSGAVALSARESLTVMNVDIGGGTSKIALCVGGKIVDRTAIDVGARLISFDREGRVTAIEEAGQRFADETGVQLKYGEVLDEKGKTKIVERMADRLCATMTAAPADDYTRALLRLEPLSDRRKPAVLTFSGGVSEYIYKKETGAFGDLGPMLANAVTTRTEHWAVELRAPAQRIRATVIGASQYTVQVSGSTIFVSQDNTLPLKNIAVISPDCSLTEDKLDSKVLSQAIDAALKRLDLQEGRQPVALYFRWQGSATYQRLDDFSRGVIEGLHPALIRNQPLILVTDSDIGGLIGLHCYEVCALSNPIVSIDGITVSEFDFVDIGEILESSGAVPVVIKSLVFPSPAS